MQDLANKFWIRWKKEYLLNLQQRQKWSKPRRNICVGDVILIKDDEDHPRNQWQLSRVIEAHQSADGDVRKVKFALSDRTLDSKGRRTKSCKFLERPVQKLVLLLEASET